MLLSKFSGGRQNFNRLRLPALAFFFALILTTAHQTRATPIVVFDEDTGSAGANTNQSVGWQFDVLSPIQVVGLSWFDAGADGLALAHTVGLWAPDGTLLASAIIPAGTVAPLDGQFRTISIAGLTLNPGVGYIVGGENFLGNPERLAFNVTQTIDPRIVYVDATYSLLGSGFTRPDVFSIVEIGFYGPSFAVQAVPEPATVALLGFGLAGVAARVRRRRRDHSSAE